MVRVQHNVPYNSRQCIAMLNGSINPSSIPVHMTSCSPQCAGGRVSERPEGSKVDA